MLNPYPDNEGPRGYNKRDPGGYQPRHAWPDEKRTATRAEIFLRQAMERSAAEDTPGQPRGERYRGHDPESRDAIYNSFTGSYHVANDGADRYDLPPHDMSEQYRTQYGEAEESPPRVRRVQFSEQLEVDTKLPPQTPTTPTIPILRTGSRAKQTSTTPTPRNSARTLYASPRHLIRPNQRDADTHIRSVPANPRDPTPRSSGRPGESSRARETRSNTGRSHQTTSDPPIHQSKVQFFSPASRKVSNNILESLERMERRNKESEQLKGTLQKQSHHGMESPSAPPPFRNAQQSQSNEGWNVRSVSLSQEDGSPSPRATRLRMLQSVDSTLSSHSNLQLHSEEPLKAYSPRSDHWDGADLYPDSWRPGTESPANATEDQSTYLINKYTKNSEASIRDISNRHEYGLESIPRTGGALRDGTNFLTPEHKHGARVQREFHSEPWSKKGLNGRGTKNGYSQLDDETEISYGENHGTELVLLPGMPKQIEIGTNDENKGGVYSTQASRKRKGLGMILSRRPEVADQTSNVPFQRLPVVAISFDDDSADLKQNTDDTDEASDSELHLRTAKWNTFDNDSISEEHTKEFLIANHRAEARKRHRLVLMLIFLVCFCLAIGLPVYFKMVNQIEPAKMEIIEASDCATGDVKTSVFSERYTTIRKYLEISPTGHVYKIDEAATPQRKALCWIADFDEREIGITKGDITALIQRYTLAVMYFSLNNHSLKESSSTLESDFLSSAHECDWEAILCNVPGKVTAILLADKLLSGALPDEVGNLSSLTFLELGLNELSGTIPTSISHLTMLEYFAIAFNGLTGTLPTELGLLTNLEFMNLRSSQIHGTIPTELGQLTALETLLLEGNWLSGTIPSSLGNLHNAQQFSFRSNYLSGKVAADICELRELSLTELEVDSWIECDCCTP